MVINTGDDAMQILRGADQFDPKNYEKQQPTVIDRQREQLEYMVRECALRADYRRQIVARIA